MAIIAASHQQQQPRQRIRSSWQSLRTHFPILAKIPVQNRRTILLFVTLLMLLLISKSRQPTDHSSLASLLLMESTPSTVRNLTRRAAATTTTTATTENDSTSYQRRKILGVDVIWQAPPSHTPTNGILLVAHGCWHHNYEWFPPTPNGSCPECTGCPEEAAIVRTARHDFGLVVVAMSPKGDCWKKKRGYEIVPVLKQLADEFSSNDQALPILAFGASVGGGFVGDQLVAVMEQLERPLAGFIALCSRPQEPDPRPRKNKNGESKPVKYPVPVAVYLTMSKDYPSVNKAKKMVKSLTSDGLAALHLDLPPIPITDSFFYEHFLVSHLTLTKEQSTNMTQALLKAGLLDDNRYLNFNPRTNTRWADIIRPHAPPEDSLEIRRSPTVEVLNKAYGWHEMSRQGLHQGLTFILTEHEKRQSQLQQQAKEQ